MTRPSDCLLALHGPVAACQAVHPGAPGFGSTVQALSQARAEGRRVFVATFVTRSSCRSLPQLVDRLVAERVAGWVVVWPRGEASFGTDASRLVPRLGIAVPHALRAVQRAQERGLLVAIEGMPSCVLGPFASDRLPSDEPGTYAEPCQGCRARAGCAGIDAWYRQRFGVQELRAVEATATVAREPSSLVALREAARMLLSGRAGETGG